jgi:sortase (surface protein transpeptidase)
VPVQRLTWTQLAAAGGVLVAAGAGLLGLAAASQQHAPQPGPAQAGVIVPARPAASSRPSSSSRTARPRLTEVRGSPVSISIPAIGVRSRLLHLGLSADDSIGVPPLDDPPLTNEAAWYKYSPVPGQPGASIIDGHVDSAADGPAVFFRLGALRPGDRVRISLSSHQVVVFRVTGVRLYAKSRYPARLVYDATSYPALRLITCGGAFDPVSRTYLSNVVAYATLLSVRPA